MHAFFLKQDIARLSFPLIFFSMYFVAVNVRKVRLDFSEAFRADPLLLSCKPPVKHPAVSLSARLDQYYILVNVAL